MVVSPQPAAKVSVSGPPEWHGVEALCVQNAERIYSANRYPKPPAYRPAKEKPRSGGVFLCGQCEKQRHEARMDRHRGGARHPLMPDFDSGNTSGPDERSSGLWKLPPAQ